MKSTKGVDNLTKTDSLAEPKEVEKIVQEFGSVGVVLHKLINGFHKDTCEVIQITPRDNNEMDPEEAQVYVDNRNTKSDIESGHLNDTYNFRELLTEEIEDLLRTSIIYLFHSSKLNIQYDRKSSLQAASLEDELQSIWKARLSPISQDTGEVEKLGIGLEAPLGDVTNYSPYALQVAVIARYVPADRFGEIFMEASNLYFSEAPELANKVSSSVAGWFTEILGHNESAMIQSKSIFARKIRSTGVLTGLARSALSQVREANKTETPSLAHAKSCSAGSTLLTVDSIIRSAEED